MLTAYKATLIINDHADIAKAVDADGVHLGLQDMPVIEAKKIIGEHKIIGGTANTFEHVIQRYNEGCHYVGVGPFRFTTTKEKLSPVLGLEGYDMLIKKQDAQGISLPIYAIGGIIPDDMEALMQTGIYGIAVSGTITNHQHKKQIVQQLNSFLYAEAFNR
jgi:thiamine-phosphate pyrophosphorylase